jgi:hypothetical protein
MPRRTKQRPKVGTGIVVKRALNSTYGNQSLNTGKHYKKPKKTKRGK